jgi:G3E family GTPase
MTVDARVPVTILTGFLGAGKTTLLNRILSEPHGRRIAVIENEFGAESIDHALLVQDRDEQIVEMNNGCICCTVRGDLVRILGKLYDKRWRKDIAFDRVIIETTGLADPAPVAQTFFVDEAVAGRYRLDAIVTVVDAVHADRQLDEHHEAQEQVGFADRILVSKTDLVEAPAAEAVERRLRAMNPTAPIARAHFGAAPIETLLDLDAFRLDDKLALDPDFLVDVSHEHDDAVASFVWRSTRPFDPRALESTFADLVAEHGVDMLRYKGVLHLDGEPRRGVLQGVHMLFAGSYGAPWAAGELRESVIVFIGRRLPEEAFRARLDGCVAPAPG